MRILKWQRRISMIILRRALKRRKKEKILQKYLTRNSYSRITVKRSKIRMNRMTKIIRIIRRKSQLIRRIIHSLLSQGRVKAKNQEVVSIIKIII